MLDTSNRVFLTTAACGNLRTASELLHLTPSAVSHSIASLERALGFSLFTRSRSGVSLTQNGRILLPYVQRLAQDHVKLDKAVASIQNSSNGVIRIGANRSTTINWLPGIARQFRQKYPDVELYVWQGLYRDIAVWLSDYTIDLAFAPYDARANAAFLPLYEDPFVCVAPADFRPRMGSMVTAEELRELNLLMDQECAEIEAVHFLRSNRLSYDKHQQIHDDQSLYMLVMAGLGVAVLPALCCTFKSDAVRVWPIAPRSCRTLGLYLADSNVVDPVAEAFREVCFDYLRHAHATAEWEMDVPTSCEGRSLV